MKKRKLIALFTTIFISIFALNGCNTTDKGGGNQTKTGEPILPTEVILKESEVTLYSNDAIKDYKTYQIPAIVEPNNATNKALGYIIEVGNDYIQVSDTGLVSVIKSNVAGVAYIKVYSKVLDSVYSIFTVNISNSNTLPSGNPYHPDNVYWDNLPQTPITSSTTTFGEKDYINKQENITPISADINKNFMALVARYQVANVSVKGENGTPIIIDNVVGSGDNMRGEFSVNAIACPEEGLHCPMGMTIVMRLKLQFHQNLIKQGIPSSLHFINSTIYSPLTSIDVGKEFGKLNPTIDEANQTVTFVLNSTQLKGYIPDGYTMTIVLKKVEDDNISVLTGNDPISIDNSKYFIENPNDVSSITINNKFSSIESGDKKEISYKILPETALNKNVSWKVEPSTAGSIEIGNDGKTYFIGKVAGETAKITATTDDGNYSDSFNVSVVEEYINVKSIKANITENVKLDINKYLTTPNKSADVIFIFNPENSSDTTLIVDSIDNSAVDASIINKNTLRINAKNITENPVNITVSSVANPDAKTVVKVEVIDSTKRITSITFPNAEVIKQIGDSNFTITPSAINPSDADNKEIKYYSSDITVARVDENTGEVTLLNKVGVTTITAKAVDGLVTGSYSLNVKQEDIHVNAIQMPSSMTIQDTATDAQITVTGYLPANANIPSEKTVTFTQDRDDYIRVDSTTGRITIIKRENSVTRVTATTPNGVTAYCDVTVTSTYVPLTNVTITNKQDIPIELKKNETFTIDTTIEPTNPTNTQLIYSVDGGSSDIVSINGNVVTATGAGEATVKVCGQSENTVCDTISFKVWEINDLTGVYTVNSFEIKWNNDSGVNSANSANIAQDRRYYEEKYFAISTKNGELKVNGKFQVVWGHMINNPRWDEFRFKYFSHTDTNFTERDMSNDRYPNKNITVNSDGTIKYKFPFTINGNQLVYSENSADYVEFNLTRKDTIYAETNTDKFREVTPVTFTDPYSFHGSYSLVDFVNHVSAKVLFVEITTGSISSREYNGKSYGGIERKEGEFTINVSSSTSNKDNRPVNMITKLQLQSSILQDEGDNVSGQCVSCGQFSYIVFNNETISPNVNSFGSTGSENQAKVYKDGENIRVEQKFYREADIGGANVSVYTWFRKTSDIKKDLTVNSNKCYFTEYNGATANALSLPNGKNCVR